MPSRLTTLLLLLTACTPRSTPEPSAAALLAGAQRALGVRDGAAETILAAATVTAPTGSFLAEVVAARDDRVRLSLGTSLQAGVATEGGWQCDSTGRPGPLDAVTRTVVRGHSLHMLAVHPEAWLGAPEHATATAWRGDSVFALQFADELRAPLRLYLRAGDTLPIGLALVNHTGQGPREVEVVFDRWEVHAGLRLFRQATFLHGENRFVYDYLTLALDTVPDSAFAPSCRKATS